MTAPSSTTRLRAAPRSAGFFQMILFALVAGAVWVELVLKLHTDWAINPQYGFGDFVPAFVLFLLSLRWRDRPPLERPKCRGLLLFAAASLLLFLLPVRILQEANPDWRLLNWVHAALVVGFNFLLISYAGGFAFARHFLIPMLLIFMAIPWPLVMEQSVIHFLSEAVARGSTAVLHLAGISASQDGTLIHLKNGDVRVEDACSGIRSLSGTLMAAVFIGEFYRLATLSRTALLAGGVVVALVLNFIRALFLTWTASVNGVGAISRWHDSAGLLIFGISFAILWFSGDRLQNIRSSQPAGAAVESPFATMHRGILIAAALWILTVEIATAAWFRLPGDRIFEKPQLIWTKESAALKFYPASAEARATLRFNEGVSAIYKPEGSRPWQLFYFQWDPGRSAAQLASVFKPELCLPADAVKVSVEKGNFNVAVNQMKFDFCLSTFTLHGTPLYVFHAVMDDCSLRGLARPIEGAVASRFQKAWLRHRNLGQQILQIVAPGPETLEEARQDVQKRLPELFH